jgi:hypothetical protein
VRSIRRVVRFVVRMVVGFVVLAAAVVGAKRLYDKYWPRVKSLRGPSEEFAEHTGVIVDETVERTHDAARDVSGAVRDAAAELRRAADDATDEAARRLRTDEPRSTQSP